MKLVNVSVKIPEGLKVILEAEAERSGTTFKRLAGQVMVHGYSDLKARQDAKNKEQEA